MTPTGNAEPEVVLRLSGVTKAFGPLVANDSINLEVRRGEVVALLGENGAGKTTLMSIIFGHYLADSGSVEAFGASLPPGSPAAAISAGVGMVHQHFTLADNLTVLDNVMVGTESPWRPWLGRLQARRKLVNLAEQLGLAMLPEAPVAALSVGERQRVEILKALYRDARILILDEPTAVLTPQEIESLFATLRRLAESGLAVVFISHKLNEVMAASDRVVVLRDGRVVATLQTAETDRGELAELMVGRALQEPRREPLAPGAPVLRLQNVTVPGGHGYPALDRASLEVREREIVGIAGVSGNGQTTLADLLSGMAAPASGEVTLLGERLSAQGPAGMIRRGVARIPEDRLSTGVIGDMTLWENTIAELYRTRTFSRFGFLNRGAAQQRARSIIEAFDVRCPSEDARIRLLSGGNIQKLILGRVLALDPRLILANQPTRGLDIGAVTYVQERLLQARGEGAGVLLISEDLDEVLALADRITVIHRGRLSPLLARDAVTIRQLGLMMAGHGEEAASDAA